MHRLGAIIIELLLFIAITYAIKLPSSQDVFHTFDHKLRVSYQEVFQTADVYASETLQQLQTMLVDSDREQVVVGARDGLLRLNINDLSLLEKVDWSPDESERSMCEMKGQTKANCRNFIRLLTRYGDDDQLLVCGTYAFQPKCAFLQASNLSTQLQPDMLGIGAVPYSPSYPHTYWASEDGSQLLTGVATDFSGFEGSLLRFLPENQRLQTADTRWLNDPEFISMFEHGNFMYVLFRETPIEHTTGKACEERVTRVGRFCKNDMGGAHILRGSFTTFTKATLLCEDVDGQRYDRLQSAKLASNGDHVVATFIDKRGNISTSAICVYRISDINDVFGRDYLHQEAPNLPWERHGNTAPFFNCKVHDAHSGKPGVTTRDLLEAQQYQLMADAVRPIGGRAIHIAPLEQYNLLVLDLVRLKHHQTVVVAFVLTDAKLLKKFTLFADKEQLCLTEVVQVSKSDWHTTPAIDMTLDTTGVYITEGNTVHRYPLAHCNRHPSRSLCLESQDPYCGWDSRRERCTIAPDRIPTHHWWHQKVNGCVALESQGDDHSKSDWSAWSSCTHLIDVHSPEHVLHCQCRTRPCTNALTCQRLETQVANCTQHGGWTSWSTWSTCSATCGAASRTRQRTCTNPTPAHNGRTCLGKSSETSFCSDLSECPAPLPPPVHGLWSDWSAWGRCSRRCAGGLRKRTRMCNNPMAANGGRSCEGCDMQYDMCNTEPCEEIRRWSEWTTWMATNASAANSAIGVVLKRYKFACQANIDDPQLLTVGSPRVEEKYCTNDNQHCKAAGFAARDGGWSKWTAWTPCSKQCGDQGTQQRLRTCTQPTPAGGGADCAGHASEIRTCNRHSCLAEWSCWSKFTECSVSCGTGERQRERVCKQMAGMRPCEGARLETEQCDAGPCNMDGFGMWSTWSACSELGVMVRLRPCLSVSVCNNVPDAQMKRCDKETGDVDTYVYETMSSSTSTASYLLLVASVLGAFLLGIVLAILIACWAVRTRSNCCYPALADGKWPSSTGSQQSSPLTNSTTATQHGGSVTRVYAPPPPGVTVVTSSKSNLYTPTPTRSMISANGHIETIQHHQTSTTHSHVTNNPLEELLMSSTSNEKIITEISDTGDFSRTAMEPLGTIDGYSTLKRAMRASLNPKDYL